MAQGFQAKELLEMMPLGFNRKAAQGVSLVYQFELTGEGGGKYYLAIQDGNCHLREGEHPSPQVTLILTAEDFCRLSAGKLPFAMAYITGRLQVRGDLRLVLRMGTYFPPPPS